MAYALIHRFKDATKEQYDNAVATVHPKDGLPPGQTIHVAGIADGDLVILAVFDSKASWETFRDKTLLPGLGSMANGPQGAPEEVTFEVHNLQTA
jgi:hypothetical protein